MLRSLKGLERYTVHAPDGDIGSVADVLLDGERWLVRLLVVRAGGFFSARRVLVSVPAMDEAWDSLSRQLQRGHRRYHDYPRYRASTRVRSACTYPNALAVDGWSDTFAPSAEPLQEAHLRSAKGITGYHLHGRDGVIGEVTDFLVDDGTWEVRYLVIETCSSWWDETRKVLVSPCWSTSFSREAREIHVDVSRETIESSPPWSKDAALDREYEARLHRHYGRPVYWEDGGFPEEAWYPRPHDSHHSA